MTPPYIGPLPSKLTVRESMETERPSPQQWSHRAYTELVHADVLPADLANVIIDCMRAYGTTTIGVVANVGRPNPNGGLADPARGVPRHRRGHGRRLTAVIR